MTRRLLIAIGVVLAVSVAVLAVQVQMARSGPRLDNEDGYDAEALTVRAGPSPVLVVWLGDSTSTGVGAGSVEETMAYRVSEAVVTGPVELTILGTSGAQVHEVLDEQVDRVRLLAPDYVFISVGANDVTNLTRRPTFRDRYDELLGELDGVVPRSNIVAVGIPDIGTAPRLPRPLRQLAGVRASQLDDVIETLAEERGVTYVDLGERTSSRFSSKPDRYFSVDEYHPSSDGHGVWADAVLAVVGRAVVARSGG